MPRPHRTDVGNVAYHVINRANARMRIFNMDEDYQLFEEVLEEAREKLGMRILAYCVMPNHFRSWKLCGIAFRKVNLTPFTYPLA